MQLFINPYLKLYSLLVGKVEDPINLKQWPGPLQLHARDIGPRSVSSRGFVATSKLSLLLVELLSNFLTDHTASNTKLLRANKRSGNMTHHPFTRPKLQKATRAMSHVDPRSSFAPVIVHPKSVYGKALLRAEACLTLRALDWLCELLDGLGRPQLGRLMLPTLCHNL